MEDHTKTEKKQAVLPIKTLLKNRKPFLVSLLGILGISLSAIFVRFSTAPSVLTATYRLLWTLLLMTPFVLGKKETRRALFKVPKRIFWLSVCSGVLLTLHFVTWFESLQHTSVASSTILVCTEVIWVALGYCLFMKGKLSYFALIAIALSFLGSILIAWTEQGERQVYGDLLSLFAALAVGAYTLLGRVVRKSTSTTVYTYIVYAASSVTLVLLTIFRRVPFFGYGVSGLFCGLLLAVFSTILGHSIFSWCLKYFSPAFVSASKLCEPVLAGLFAALLFNELPTLLQILGGILVLCGVIAYTLLELKQKTPDL